MSYANTAALNPAVVVPTIEDTINADRLVADASDAIKDKKVNNFRMHLIRSVSTVSVAEYFAGYEARYKAEAKVTAMPVHHRTNKSVLLSCEKLGIPVLDEQGMPRGKSELDKAIGAAKAPKSPMDRALKALEVMTKASDELDQNELDVLMSSVCAVFPQLVVVKKAAA